MLNLYCDCEVCYKEIDFTESRICILCEMQMCEECFQENDGFCEDCFKKIKRERSDEEEELWRGFWESRF